MIKIMSVCIILHNMIMELRRGSFKSHLLELALSTVGRNAIIDPDGNEIPFELANPSSDGHTPSSNLAGVVPQLDFRITDEAQHFALKADLVEHIWNNFTNH